MRTHETLQDLIAFSAFGFGLGFGVAAGFVLANELAGLIWRMLA